MSMTILISQAFQRSDTTVDRRAVIPLIKVCEETTLLGQTRIANKFKSHQGCRLFGICLNLKRILHPIPWNTIAGAVDNCKLNSSSERERKN